MDALGAGWTLGRVASRWAPRRELVPRSWSPEGRGSARAGRPQGHFWHGHCYAQESGGHNEAGMLTHRTPAGGRALPLSSAAPPCCSASWPCSPHSGGLHPPLLGVCPWGPGGSQGEARSLGCSGHPSRRERTLPGTTPRGAGPLVAGHSAPVPRCRSQGLSSPRLGCPSGSWAYSPSLFCPHGALPEGVPGLHKAGAAPAAAGGGAGTGLPLPMGRLRGLPAGGRGLVP